MNREEWLNNLTEKMRPMYHDALAVVPQKIRLTCGWPSRRAFGSKNRTIGECWPSQASKDQTVEVFISPCLSDPLKVAEVLAHELVHATGQKGHKAGFRRVALAIGLEGKMTATHAGPQLVERLNALISEVGPYPHAELDKEQSPHKKDTTRMLKCVCPGCGYTVRTTQKWLDVCAPTCTTCECLMEVEIKGA